MSDFIVTCDEEAALWIGNDADSMNPLVRCRNCKYYESVSEDSGDWCGYWTDRIYADVRGSGFCAWGTRKEME